MSIPFIDLKTQYNEMKVEIQEAIDQVLESGQFIMGPPVEACEQSLKEFVGCKHALTVSNGTDALQMALMALGVGPGDEVIVPGFSFFATAEVVSLVGAKPVFVDVYEDTYNINVELIENAVTDKTKAIIPVGLYGQVADMEKISQLASKHGLSVVEDAAQSFGARLGDKRSCNLSDLGTTSFFPAKPLGCYGDGGAIFTNNDELAEALYQIRVHGQERGKRYTHARIGINGRMDTLQCAILSVKLKKYDWEIEQRQRVAQFYNNHLKDLSAVVLPTVKSNHLSVWAQYTIRVPQREAFQAFLKEKGVPTAIHYPSPMHRQQAYAEEYKGLELPVSDRVCQEVVSLPMHPYMQEQDQEKIVTAIKEWTSTL